MKLTELFEILLKIPNHFDHVDSFHPDNIPGCVQSCLDHVRKTNLFRFTLDSSLLDSLCFCIIEVYLTKITIHYQQ